MKGNTVVGISKPAAKPHAAITPLYFVCANAVPRVVEPTLSTTAAQISFSNGLLFLARSSLAMISEAPSALRYAAVSGRPVDAVTE